MSARARGKRRGGKEADSEKAAAPGDCLGTGGPGASSDEKLGGVVSAAEMSAAMKRILAKRMAEMNAGVEKDFAEWLDARRLAQKSGMSPGHGGAAGTGAVAGEKILSHGRLRFRPGFEDVWLGNTHHDLREWKKARLCLQYLVEKRSFDAASARHFLEEIDPHVRKQGDYLRSAEIKIDHYFNDRSGRLRMLRKDLIQAAGRSGRYFLKVE